MSNYIHSQNQTILWNTVNRIPSFIQLSPPKRDLEFKRITEHFYRQCSHKPNLSISELQEINRQTIMAFVSPASLPLSNPSIPTQQGQGPVQVQGGRPPLHPNTNTNSLLPNQNPNQNPNQFQNPDVNSLAVFETRQEKQERAFQDRQNMYAQMTERPNPPVPEMFKEIVEDVKITNMDELIASYQKQRNLEIPVLPPIIPSPSVQPQVKKQETKRITFLEGAVDPISLQIQDLDLEKAKEKENGQKKNLALNDSGEKKNLAWNVNLEETRIIEESYLQELEKRIGNLEQKLKIETERREKIEDKWDRKEIEEKMDSILVSIEQQLSIQ